MRGIAVAAGSVPFVSFLIHCCEVKTQQIRNTVVGTRDNNLKRVIKILSLLDLSVCD